MYTSCNCRRRCVLVQVMNKITQAFGWTALISGVRFRIGSLLPPTRKGRRQCKVSTRFDGLRRPGYCITCCSIRRHESQGYCHRSDTITPVLMRFGVSGVGLELFSFTPPPLPDNGIKVTVGSMVSDLRFVPTLSRRDRVWRATE